MKVQGWGWGCGSGMHVCSLHTPGKDDVAWSQAQPGAIALVKFMVLLLHILYVIKRAGDVIGVDNKYVNG